MPPHKKRPRCEQSAGGDSGDRCLEGNNQGTEPTTDVQKLNPSAFKVQLFPSALNRGHYMLGGHVLSLYGVGMALPRSAFCSSD